MESSFDGRYGAVDLYVHAIASASNNLEAVHLREMNHGVVLCLGGSKTSVNSGR
jgi:hypothetical protein